MSLTGARSSIPVVTLIRIGIALLAALFGFGGVASTAMGGAHMLIWVAVIIVVVGILFGVMRRV